MALNDLFTKKQQKVLQSYLNDNWKYLFLIGAVRSGKTYISNWMLLLELKRVAKLAKKNNIKRPIYILAGYSSNSIYTNIIASIENEFGISIPVDRHGHYSLLGVEIVPAYTGSVRGIGSIRGATAYGALIDEATLADQGVFQEIINRCSVEGARILITSNPDSPTNFIKTDYLDNKDPKARIKVFNFTIFDNTFLSKDYVDSLVAATPSGMYTDRMIYGKWVSAEGQIFSDFNIETMTITTDQLPEMTKYYASIDWGFGKGHKGVIQLFGDDDKGTSYLIKEWAHEHRFIDYWIDIAKEIKQKYGNIVFWADSARVDYVNQMQTNGINCINANKNVLSGLEFVDSYFKQGKLIINKDEAPNLLNTIFNYVWDDKKEAPIKKDDDSEDCLRYGIYSEHYKGGGYIPWN